MRLRKINPSIIIDSIILLKNAEIEIDDLFLQAYYLGGGNVLNLTDGIIYAKLKNVDITHKDLAQAGLNHIDIKQFVDKYIEKKDNIKKDISKESPL